MSTSGECHECIEGCSEHQRDIMIYVGGYHEYIEDYVVKLMEKSLSLILETLMYSWHPPHES